MSTSPDLSLDRFRRLHAAQRVITSDLSVDVMLPRIAQAACDVVEVQFSALAIVAPDDTIEHIEHHGLDDDVARFLYALRTGTKLAAALRRWSRVGSQARSRDVTLADTENSELRSVDILVSGTVFAQLHLASPVAGQFSGADDELIQAMARSVGSALEHAQLFDRARRSTEWLHASGEIARALLADADVDLMGEIVARAVTAADADYGQLVVPTESGDLQLIATAGLGSDELQGRVYPADTSDLGRSIVNAKTLRMTNLGEFLSDRFDNHHRYAAFMLAPLVDAQGTRGSLMITRVAGRSMFASYELDLFATYSAQVALAMQFADARADAERLQVLETRHDTARELHDIVMQRLFATGVGMHSLTAAITDSAQAETLSRYVRELDDTIDEIRDRVFGLRGDAQAAEPSITRFPRIALDAAKTARAAGTSATRAALRRGRRRTDWTDGSGRQRD